MSLNNIKLGSRILTELYPHSLIESGTTTMPESPAVRFLGKNQKKIVLLVSYDSVPFLPDGELAFLTTILTACKLSLADISIVNMFGQQHPPQELLGQLEAKQVLLFGMEPLAIDLPINFPAFQLQPFNNRTYLYSPSLAELQKDLELKKKLWNCLKILFSL